MHALRHRHRDDGCHRARSMRFLGNMEIYLIIILDLALSQLKFLFFTSFNNLYNLPTSISSLRVVAALKLSMFQASDDAWLDIILMTVS